MKAVRIHAFGGPEVVTYEDVPTPTPKENEVLFKVTSTCINYADVQWRLGNYVDRTLPATLGREAAGVIESVGPGVATLNVGQRIMARAVGGNAEYAIAADLLDLDEAGVKALATAAVDASFAPDDVKSRLRGEIADYGNRA